MAFGSLCPWSAADDGGPHGFKLRGPPGSKACAHWLRADGSKARCHWPRGVGLWSVDRNGAGREEAEPQPETERERARAEETTLEDE
ncbi:unnamed protein product [Caretta caretta]